MIIILMQLELLFLILRCAGYYSIANVEVDSNTSNGDVALDASGKGGLRGGFEWGKFRMGLEYNLVPKSTLQDTSGNNRGTISNSYLEFT
jgi:hypothetical protein